MNFAVHATRLGAAAGYVGAVGDDERGAQLRQALQAEAVDTAHLLLDHEEAPHTMERGGRKAHRLVLDELGVDEGEAAPVSS